MSISSERQRKARAAAAPFPPRERIVSARSKAANLGLNDDLTTLSPEHWQRLLTDVEATMRMRGVEIPEHWREVLAEQAGRGSERYDGPES